MLEVCVLEYMHSTCLCIMCVDRIEVCVLCSCGDIYTHCLDVWQMPYGVRVLHLQHRHGFRRFDMKCMAAILNVYSLHLHIYDRCGVRARLTWLFVEVSTHLYSTDTLTRAHTH